MNSFLRYLALTSLSVSIALGSAGCKSNQTPANTANTQDQSQPQDPSQDPASANVAPISQRLRLSPPGTPQTRLLPQMATRKCAYVERSE